MKTRKEAVTELNMKMATTKIAKEYLALETLKMRNRDEDDFSEQSVWSIRQALEAAFKAGAAQAK